MNAQEAEDLEEGLRTAAKAIGGKVVENFEAEVVLPSGHKITAYPDFDFGEYTVCLYVPEGEDPWLCESALTRVGIKTAADRFREVAAEDSAR